MTSEERCQSQDSNSGLRCEGQTHNPGDIYIYIYIYSKIVHNPQLEQRTAKSSPKKNKKGHSTKIFQKLKTILKKTTEEEKNTKQT